MLWMLPRCYGCYLDVMDVILMLVMEPTLMLAMLPALGMHHLFRGLVGLRHRSLCLHNWWAGAMEEATP